MRLTRIEIYGFGKWQNQHFEIDTPCLLVFGSNESGKSTLYHFIRAMLFGFPKKRDKIRDFTPAAGVLFGGRLTCRHAVHGELIIERVREKNNGKSVVYLGDQRIVGDDFLEQLLAPLTQTVFDQVFSFQQEQLGDVVHLNEEVLQRTLLSVGLTGTRQLEMAEADFFKQRQEIYKPAGRKPLLNQELSRLAELEAQISVKEAQIQDYQLLLERKAQHHQQLERLAEAADLLADELAQKEKQQQHWPLFQEYRAISRQLDTAVVYEAERETVERLYRDWQYLQAEEQRLLHEQMQQTDLSQSGAFSFYLAHEAQFEQLAASVPHVEKLSLYQAHLEEQLQETAREMADLAARYQIDETADPTPLSVHDEQAIQHLSGEEERMSQRLAAIQREKETQLSDIAQLEQQLADTEKKLGKLPLPYPAVVLAGVLVIVLAAVGVLTAQLWFAAAAIVLAGVGFGSFLLGSGKRQLAAKEIYRTQLSQMDVLQDRRRVLEQEQEECEREQQTQQQKKIQLAETFGFNQESSLRDWLIQLPGRTRMQQLLVKQQSLTNQLTANNQQLEQSRLAVSFAEKWIQIANLPILDAYGRVKSFVEEQQQLKQTKLAGTAEGQNREQLSRLARNKTEKEHDLSLVMKQAEIKRFEDIPAWLEEQQQLQDKQRRREELLLILDGLFDFQTSYEAAELAAQIAACHKKTARIREQVKQEQSAYHEVGYALRQIEQDGTLDELYQKKASQLDVIEELSRDWLSYRFAERLTQDVFQYLSDQQLPALLATAGSFFNTLTLSRYDKLLIDGQQLAVRDAQQRTFGIRQLSTGVQDQLYIAFRLAFVHLHHDHYPSPMIIDDGWLHFDEDRKKAFHSLLVQLSSRIQIICLSSDMAMKRLFEQSDGRILRLNEEEKE